MDTITIGGEERKKIIDHMIHILNHANQKGKRFRESHDLTCRSDPIVVQNQIVNTNKLTDPVCVICSEMIPKGVDRCKFSIVHMKDRSKTEHCGTHVYCIPCFVTLNSCTAEGKQAVCFGTCLNHRGGCRQVMID